MRYPLFLAGFGLALLTSCASVSESCGGFGFGAPGFGIRLKKGHDDHIVIPQGGEVTFSVCVDRFGLYGKPIDVTISGAPKGVSADPARISSGSFHTRLTLRAAPDLAIVAPAEIHIRGETPVENHEFPIHVEVRGRPGSADRSWGSAGHAAYGQDDAVIDATVEALASSSFLETRLVVVRNGWDAAGAHTFVSQVDGNGERTRNVRVDGLVSKAVRMESNDLDVAGVGEDGGAAHFAWTVVGADGGGPFVAALANAPAPSGAIFADGWYAFTNDPAAQIVEVSGSGEAAAFSPFGADQVVTALWYDEVLFSAVQGPDGTSEIDRFVGSAPVRADPSVRIPGRVENGTVAVPFLYLTGTRSSGDGFLLRLRDGQPDGTFGIAGWITSPEWRFGDVLPKDDGSAVVLLRDGVTCEAVHVNPRGRVLHDFGPAMTCGENPSLVRSADGRVYLVGDASPGFFVDRFWDERIPPPEDQN